MLYEICSIFAGQGRAGSTPLEELQNDRFQTFFRRNTDDIGMFRQRQSAIAADNDLSAVVKEMLDLLSAKW